MNIPKIIRMFSLPLFVIWIVCGSLNAADDPRAKEAFYGDKAIFKKPPGDPVPGKPEGNRDYYSRVKPGIKYWIELVSPDDAPQRVSNDRTFQSDEKIRVHISTNADGYLCVLHEGSTGSSEIIPISDAGNGEVKIGVDYVVPSKEGWLRFDDNPGEEKLKLLFASVNSSGDVLNVMRRPSADQLLQIYSKYIENPNVVRYVERGITRSIPLAASRNLIVENNKPVTEVFNIQSKPDFKTDSAVYNAPANYVVNIPADRNLKEPVAVEISLLHRSKTP